MAFDGQLKFDTSIDQTGFQSGLTGLADMAKSGLSGLANMGVSAVTGAMTALTGATAAATGAVTALGKQAVESYADFEQLAGGVETLFGDSAQIVMNNAAKAFETAGMSANQYMEMATASAAAMVSSLAGDTKRAAELTDMAVVDMSDNINKMGSTAESVQNAYAGFAKGNFTMLDNLKLGYGGTKQEMERLLQEAKKLTGIEYSIDSYSDIVQAIHAVQVEMKISGISAEEAAKLVASGALTQEEAFERMGTTAKEAQETISGSVAMVKAAWDNLLVGVADDTQDFDKLTENLVTSVEAAAKNILPRVEVTAGGIVKLVDGLSDEAAQLLADLAGYVPMATNAGVSLIRALANGIRDNLPQLLNAGQNTILNLSDGIADAAPVLFDAAGGIATGLAESLSNPQVISSIGRAGSAIASGFVSGISGSAPAMIQAGLDMGLKMLSGFGDITVNFLDLGANLMSGLATGIESKHLRITRISREIIRNLIQAIGSDLPMMIESGAEIISILADSILFNLPYLTEYGNEAVQKIAEAIKKSLPDILEVGAGLIGAFGGAILDSLPVLLECAVQIVDALVGTISNPDDLSALIGAATLIVTTLGGALLDNLPILLNAGMQIVSMLMDTLSDPEALTKLLDAGLQIITKLAEILTENLSPLLGAVIQIIGTLGEWIGEHALDLVSAGLVIVKALTDAVIQNLPLLLDAAVQIVEGLAKGIEKDSADVLIAVEEIIRTLLNFLLSPDTLQKIGETGGKIIRALIPAAVELAGDLLGFAYDLFDETIAAVAKMQWGEIGKEIVEGIISGMIGTEFDLDSYLKEFKKNWVSGFKDIFGIHSPSTVMRDEIGKNLALGLGEGFSDNITNAAEQAFDTITDIHVDPAALEMMMNASPMQMNFIQPSPTASITNNYTTNATTNSANYSTENAPSGDIIIPVQIGGEQVETLVITAAQIANARSGGEVL